jgi:pyruvate/2-oxoglutarate dehydrogenase complex dihydrolipoamide acyltransferase (E2) component
MRDVPVIVDDLGAFPARFSLWYVAVGEKVAAGDRIAELVIPGLVSDVCSPCDGILTIVAVRPGDDVFLGQTIGTLRTDESS